MQISLSELITKLREDTHPQALPENLVATYNRLVVEGLVVLQKWVDCLQQNNTQLYPFCSTYWDCNATVVPAPKGRIKRVFTIQSDQKCDKVFYRQLSYDRLLCAAKAYGLVEAPDQTGYAEQEEPFKIANSSTDQARGRARYGYYAINRGRVYAFPYLHSSETLVIEWDGLKRDWKDDDLVNGGPEVFRALRLYVSKEMSRDYDRDLNSYQTQAIEFQEALRDLIHECREETRVRDHEICDPGMACSDETCKAIEAATAAAPSTSIVFANIGDFGNASNGTAMEDVANLVKSWGPAFIVTNGDNIYGSDDYDGVVGAQYGAYITSDLQTNKFWPALGNHDYQDAGLDKYQAYFTLPNNERYYDFIRNGVHFFIVNSSLPTLGGATPEPDGVGSGLIQGDWLRLSLAVSSANWKVVIVHDPPYTDHVDFPGHTVLRWPFKDWGADVVISGDAHAYLRYEVDGFPYLVNGLGGSTIASLQATPNANDSIRQASYIENYGAIRGTVSCDTLTFEFINILGTVIDTLTLTK